METMTTLGDVYLPLLSIILVFNFYSWCDSLYIWTTYGFIAYVNAQMKSVYADPRPFWASTAISPAGCRSDFGNPSGHTQTTAFFWITLYLQLYANTDKNNKYRPKSPLGYVV